MSRNLSFFVLIHQVSENSGYYALVLGFDFFLGHRTRGFALEKQTVTHVTKNDTHAAFLGIISSDLHFVQK